MIFGTINLVEGSETQTLTVSSGGTLPSGPTNGQLYYLDSGSSQGLYMYESISSSWDKMLSHSSATSADIITALGFTPLSSAGGTLSGPLVLSADPVTSLGAATKQYVDNVASGVNVHAAVQTASTGPLPACTYVNGTGGVGATLTASASGLLSVGGYGALAAGNRVLIKDQASPVQNGIYTVTTLGGVGSSWVLTRATDFDGSPLSEVVAGDLTFVQEGSLAGTQWVQVNNGTGTSGGSSSYDYVVVGTDSITFSQFAGAGTYSGGTGISVASNLITNTGVTSVSSGSGISVSASTGSVSISNTGVTSITGTANQIATSAASGNITLSLPSNVSIPGNFKAGGFYQRSTAYSLTATGSNQAAALQLTAEINAISTVPASSGVILPVSIGTTFIVINYGTNPLNVYPPVGAVIDSGGLNVPFSLPVGAKLMFIQVSGTQFATLNATFA